MRSQMTASERERFELPPTAGLPGRYADFIRRPPHSFEYGLQDWLGVPPPLLLCSGTAALIVCLHVLKQISPERSQVIIPAYTCPLVPLAVHMVPGLQPVLCDIEPGGIDFAPEKLAAACGRRTLAIIPTHLGGRVADVPAALAIAGTVGAFVVEDAAQALGSFTEGVIPNRRASVGLRGDAGFFSLAAGKGLTTYEGGVLISRRDDLRTAFQAAARTVLHRGLLMNLRRNLELLAYCFFYRPSRLWHVYGRKLTRELDKGDEAAAVGDIFSADDIPLHGLDFLRRRAAANALQRLPAYLKQGRTRAAERLVTLHGITGVTVIQDKATDNGVWPFFMLLLPDREKRDRALQRLWKSGFGVSKLFVSVLPDYDFVRDILPVAGKSREYRNARDLSGRMLTISNTHWLNEDIFTRIVEEICIVL